MLTVNASGCAPAPRRGPDAEPHPWTEYLGTPGRAPSAAEQPPTDPHLVWTARVGPSVAALAVGDSVIAAQATDRNLTLLWRHSGERAWRSRLNAPGVSAPLLTEDRVYAATGGPKGQVYAFTLEDGRRAWSRRLGPIHGPLASVGARIFATTEQGWVFAIDTDDGSIVWSRRLAPVTRAGVVPVDTRLAVASDDSLYLVDPATGETDAAAATRGTVFSPPAITDEVVIVTSPDGFIAAFHATTLREQWRIDTGQPIFGSPAVARDTVFAVTSGGDLWTIPLASPQEADHISIDASTRAPPTPVSQGVLVGTLSGEVMWVVAHQGAPRWRVPFDGPVELPVIVQGGDLVVAEGRGTVQVWR